VKMVLGGLCTNGQVAVHSYVVGPVNVSTIHGIQSGPPEPTHDDGFASTSAYTTSPAAALTVPEHPDVQVTAATPLT